MISLCQKKKKIIKEGIFIKKMLCFCMVLFGLLYLGGIHNTATANNVSGINFDDIKFVPVDSSAISEIGYSETERALFVRFKESRELYQYDGVTHAVYKALLEADSKGEFFNDYIKDKYDYTRLKRTVKYTFTDEGFSIYIPDVMQIITTDKYNYETDAFGIEKIHSVQEMLKQNNGIMVLIDPQYTYEDEVYAYPSDIEFDFNELKESDRQDVEEVFISEIQTISGASILKKQWETINDKIFFYLILKDGDNKTSYHYYTNSNKYIIEFRAIPSDEKYEQKAEESLSAVVSEVEFVSGKEGKESTVLSAFYKFILFCAVVGVGGILYGFFDATNIKLNKRNILLERRTIDDEYLPFKDQYELRKHILAKAKHVTYLTRGVALNLANERNPFSGLLLDIVWVIAVVLPIIEAFYYKNYFILISAVINVLIPIKARSIKPWMWICIVIAGTFIPIKAVFFIGINAITIKLLYDYWYLYVNRLANATLANDQALFEEYWQKAMFAINKSGVVYFCPPKINIPESHVETDVRKNRNGLHLISKKQKKSEEQYHTEEENYEAKSVPSDNSQRRFCSNCGTEVPYGGIFCLKCGEKLVLNEDRGILRNDNTIDENVYNSLYKLKSLYDDGILTENEYLEKKRQLLGIHGEKNE